MSSRRADYSNSMQRLAITSKCFVMYCASPRKFCCHNGRAVATKLRRGDARKMEERDARRAKGRVKRVLETRMNRGLQA